MIIYDESTLAKILEMYVVSARYLTHMELYPSRINSSLPSAIARIHIPPKPVYLVDNVNILHVNNTDAAFIINQAVFGFYRWALMNGTLGFSQMSLKTMRLFYDKMFIKREIRNYERFVARDRTDLVVQLRHDNSRKVGNAHMVWCEVIIPGFLRASIVGGMKLES